MNLSVDDPALDSAFQKILSAEEFEAFRAARITSKKDDAFQLRMQKLVTGLGFFKHPNPMRLLEADRNASALVSRFTEHPGIVRLEAEELAAVFRFFFDVSEKQGFQLGGLEGVSVEDLDELISMNLAHHLPTFYTENSSLDLRQTESRAALVLDLFPESQSFILLSRLVTDPFNRVDLFPLFLKRAETMIVKNQKAAAYGLKLFILGDLRSARIRSLPLTVETEIWQRPLLYFDVIGTMMRRDPCRSYSCLLRHISFVREVLTTTAPWRISQLKKEDFRTLAVLMVTTGTWPIEPYRGLIREWWLSSSIGHERKELEKWIGAAYSPQELYAIEALVAECRRSRPD